MFLIAVADVFGCSGGLTCCWRGIRTTTAVSTPFEFPWLRSGPQTSSCTTSTCLCLLNFTLGLSTYRVGQKQ